VSSIVTHELNLLFLLKFTLPKHDIKKTSFVRLVSLCSRKVGSVSCALNSLCMYIVRAVYFREASPSDDHFEVGPTGCNIKVAAHPSSDQIHVAATSKSMAHRKDI